MTTKITTWEYKIISCTPSNLTLLNNLGHEGWEAVGSYGSYSHEVLLKRPIGHLLKMESKPLDSDKP